MKTNLVLDEVLRRYPHLRGKVTDAREMTDYGRFVEVLIDGKWVGLTEAIANENSETKA